MSLAYAATKLWCLPYMNMRGKIDTGTSESTYKSGRWYWTAIGNNKVGMSYRSLSAC